MPTGEKGADFDQADWELFYASIEGFDYEPGNIYEIRVRETQLPAAQVPADASSIRYELVDLISKRPDPKVGLNDNFALESVGGEPIDSDVNTRPTIEFNLREMRYFGTDGCNNFNGSIASVTEGDLSIGMRAGTRKACRNTELPNQVNAALDKVAGYERNGLALRLLAEDGDTLLTYRKVD